MASSGKEGPRVNSRPGLFRRIYTAMALLVLVCWGVAFLAGLLDLETRLTLLLLLLAGLLTALWLASWVMKPLGRALKMMESGIRSMEDGDFSTRLVVAGEPEIRHLISCFNDLADLIQRERGAIYQKELLLDTVIETAPMAILLLGPTGRLILANREATRIFGLNRSPLGLSLEDLAQDAPEEMRQALERPRDALISLNREGETEVFHMAQRVFRLNAMPHRLLMIRHLTREFRRQEVETWKKLIRLINHELNNTLAPIRSLLHSARTIVGKPDHYHKLDRVFETMDRTTRHLQKFLEDYAAFARLPMPVKAEWRWDTFLADLRELIPFELENRLRAEKGCFDAGQIQQALLNLLKNAHEASAEGDPVTLRLSTTADGGALIQVIDQGRGMTPDALSKALLPFFSTKKAGTGLGLPLCKEIFESHGGGIRIQHGEGGGIEVACLLPPS